MEIITVRLKVSLEQLEHSSDGASACLSYSNGAGPTRSRPVSPATPLILRITSYTTTTIILIGLAGIICGQGGTAAAERMVRLCIASVDPARLSSQCVMCNRREFPLTVIDCTGITKVNDLIANPLSVQEATCLIYNCRRQVPDVKPEPYHGSVSHAANYRGASAASASPGYATPPAPAAMGPPMGQSGSQLYEMMTPSGMFGGGGFAMGAMSPASPYMSRYGATAFGSYGQASGASGASYPPLGALTSKGLIGEPNFSSSRHRGPLPYALVPAPSTFPFGLRNKYKMALMPLFR